jgi:hypothetical protein
MSRPKKTAGWVPKALRYPLVLEMFLIYYNIARGEDVKARNYGLG